MTGLAHAVGEQTLFNRTGRAVAAVGMAQIFSAPSGERLLSIWYHFAIMFEALFILTVLDAGTRVGRFMIQELGAACETVRENQLAAWSLLSSALIVARGYFLYQGVIDPLVNQFIVAAVRNLDQLLAAVALVVATTILLKMGKLRWIWVTLLPMTWLVIITMTQAGRKSSRPIRASASFPRRTRWQRKSPQEKSRCKDCGNAALIFNQRLDAYDCNIAIMIWFCWWKR